MCECRGREFVFFFSSRRRHTRLVSDWSSDVCSSDLMRPGELVVGNDSHTISYGALNCGGMGITRADMLYVLLFGELWFQVPQSVKVVLNGRQPSYPIAKDIILYLAGQYGDD